MRTVALYIYIDELIDDVITPVAHRIELFKDEDINITSSIQNFRDLGKIFTDYSKSFTIPASTVNNKILKHWYNSEVGSTSLDSVTNVDGAFDHRISYYGFIEIDTIPFRYGKFLLKGSSKKDNKIESYNIVFTGNLVQLKDRFKDDKLNSLSTIIDDIKISLYAEQNHSWELSEVESRVTTGGSYDVMYPVIGTARRLMLNSGGADDISTTLGRLHFDELFPALRVSKILEYIQTAYGITFQGAFINSQTFTKLFLYLKNQDKLIIKSEKIMVDFDTKWDYTRFSEIWHPEFGIIDDHAYPYSDLNLINNTVTLGNNITSPPFVFPNTADTIWYKSRFLELLIYTDSVNPYNLYVYNNGLLYCTFENLFGNTGNAIFQPTNIGGAANAIYNFTFYISSDTGVTFTTTIFERCELNSYLAPGSSLDLLHTEYQIRQGFSSAQTTTSSIDIQTFIPDITVEAFVSGLIKMFNLMVIPTSETSFYLQPLNEYYADGKNWDLTKYVVPENISIDAPQLYKKVEFKYDKSPNILNENFRGLYNKEYGDLNFENKNSAFAETYTVALPFEDFMFERETDTNFLTATIWNKDSKPYVPKPSLLYLNGLEEVIPSIKIGDNSITHTITNYNRFSNELALASSDFGYIQSLNWGAEISAWYLNICFIGLYEKFYSNYIENLFNQRARVLKLKTILPNSVLCFLKLKDKIIVSNKRYIINTMTPNLTNGETSFELILDSNYINNTDNVQTFRYSNLSSLNIDNTAQKIEAQIFLKNNDLWRGKAATGFLVDSYALGTNFYEDGLLDLNIPANTTGLVRCDYVLIEYSLNGVSTIISIPVIQAA